MSRNILFTLVFIVCLQLCGCGDDKKKDESKIVGDPVDENCAANNTGELLYRNSSQTAFFVSINGLNHGVVNPGETLRANLDAGYQVTAHSLWVDGVAACPDASAPIIQCQSRGIDCSMPR